MRYVYLVTLLVLPHVLFSQTNGRQQQKNENKEIASFSVENKEDAKPLKGSFIAIQFDNKAIILHSWNDIKGNEKDIREILIQQQEITSFPKELLAFKNLESIDLSNNKIKELNFSVFKQFPKLERLYLNNNLIPEVDIANFAEKNPHIQVFFKPEHFTK